MRPSDMLQLAELNRRLVAARHQANPDRRRAWRGDRGQQMLVWLLIFAVVIVAVAFWPRSADAQGYTPARFTITATAKPITCRLDYALAAYQRAEVYCSLPRGAQLPMEPVRTALRSGDPRVDISLAFLFTKPAQVVVFTLQNETPVPAAGVAYVQVF